MAARKNTDKTDVVEVEETADKTEAIKKVNAVVPASLVAGSTFASRKSARAHVRG